MPRSRGRRGRPKDMTGWLVIHSSDYGNPDPIVFSGRRKEEWLQLADTMLARWAEFRKTVEALRDPNG